MGTFFTPVFVRSPQIFLRLLFPVKTLKPFGLEHNGNTFINNSGPSLALNRYYHSCAVTPEDSSVVPMDLVNPIESICNPLEERKNKLNFTFS